MGLFSKFKKNKNPNKSIPQSKSKIIEPKINVSNKPIIKKFDGEHFHISDEDNIVYEISNEQLHKVYINALIQINDKKELEEFKGLLFKKYPSFEEYLINYHKKMEEEEIKINSFNKYHSLVHSYTRDAKRYMESGDIDDAIAKYEIVITKYKFGFPFPYLDLIKMYTEKNQIKNIIRVCDLAIDNIGNEGYITDSGEIFFKKTDKISETYGVEYYKKVKSEFEYLLNMDEDEIINALNNIEPLIYEPQFYINAIVDKNNYKNSKIIESEHSNEFIFEFYNQYIKYNNIEKPYKRLAIIYRKLKRFEDEVKICKLAINDLEDYKSVSYFKDRLTKAERKLEKSKLNKN